MRHERLAAAGYALMAVVSGGLMLARAIETHNVRKAEER